MTSLTNFDENGVDNVISIIPANIFFGVISNGFIYRCSFKVKNHLLVPIKTKITITPVDENEKNSLKLLQMPEKIAPGMSFTMKLELTADHVTTSYFTINIAQNHNDKVVTRVASANIVSIDTFKHVKKSLQLNNRPVYRKNVEAVGNTPDFEANATSSMLNSIVSSNTSLMMMDNDEMEDMMDYPIASNLYWDPFAKCMRIDPEAGKMYVSTNLKKALKKTKKKNQIRLKELEEQGFFTINTLASVGGIQSASASILSAMESDSDEEDVPKKNDDQHVEDDEEKKDILTEMKGSLHSGTSFKEGARLEDDGSVASEDSTFEQLAAQSQDMSRMSVTGILAMKRSKRERVEKQRRASILAAESFAATSAKDSMVDSQRTLDMIRARVTGVKPISAEEKVN